MGITLQDVALRAKVSRSAASVVLGSSGSTSVRVSPKTRLRIQEAASRLGYRPNLMARGLRGGQTQSIGLVWSLMGVPAYAAVVRDIAMRMHTRGYLVHPYHFEFGVETAVPALETLVARGVDAVVFQGSPKLVHDRAISGLLSKFPATVVVSALPMECSFDVIVQDRLEAHRRVADHFAAIGRRRPALLIRTEANLEKIEAFRDRLVERGIPASGHVIIELLSSQPDVTGADFRVSLDAACGDGVPFDALLCGSDEGAAASIAWLRERGKRVPADVAVVGCNNNDFAAYFEPALASIERHEGRVVDAIERMVLRRLSDASAPRAVENVEMTFTWRTSAGEIPGADPRSQTISAGMNA